MCTFHPENGFCITITANKKILLGKICLPKEKINFRKYHVAITYRISPGHYIVVC